MKQVPYRLAEALEKLCKKKSLENITVSQIALEAGVTRQVFYHHFKDKFELASWIHYVHLYQAVKQALEENPQQMWCSTTVNWLTRLAKNKEFYVNAFQSASQKEFQRIIRDFLLTAFQFLLEENTNRPLTEEERFALRVFGIGSMEMVSEWLKNGAAVPTEQMMERFEISMPELIRAKALEIKYIPYEKATKTMEEFLFKEGLLQWIS